VLFRSTFFVAPQALEYFTVWSPEALFFALGMCAAAIVWRELVYRGRPFVSGLAIGLCIATKFTFVAWVPAHLLALAVARRWRSMPAAIAGYAVAFFAGTIAVWPNFPQIFGRLAQFASRSGAYGSGSAAPPTLHAVFSTVSEAVAGSKVWHVALFLAFAGAVIAVIRQRDLLPPLVFAVTAIVMTYAAAIRYMPARYLLANGVSAALLVAIAAHAVRRPPITAALCILAAIVGAKTIAADLRTHHTRIADGFAVHDAIHAALGPTPGTVVYGWRAPEPSFALRILAYNDAWFREIEKRYPRDGHYNAWHHAVVLPAGTPRWDYAVVSDEDAGVLGGVRVGRAGGYNIIRR